VGLIPLGLFIDMILRLLGIQIPGPEDPVLYLTVSVIGGIAIYFLLFHRRLTTLKGKKEK
jgi:hypothetical protein